MQAGHDQQCALADQKANHIMGCIRRNMARKVKGGDPVPLLCVGETSPGVPNSDMESSVKRDIDQLKHIQRKAMKMIHGMEHLFPKDQLKELGLLSLKKRKIQEN